MSNLTVDIKPTRTYSAYIAAPFDQGKEALEREGYSIISLEENAQLRMQQGPNSFVSGNGNWTKEGVIYIPKRGIFLTKKSPIMANAQEATACHRNNKDFYLTDAQVEASLADSVLLTGQSIPTNRFSEDPVTIYAFGEAADQYGQFLRSTGIEGMPVLLATLQDKPFARQMWFHGVDGGSCLGGDWVLGYVLVRGVRQGGEATVKNFEVHPPEAYTLQDIQRVLKERNLTGLEGMLLSSLRQ